MLGLDIISMRNVYKTYPNGVGAIFNLNLSIDKGDFVFIIGGSGSGKSTLINLVPRFYDATDGEVLIDGVNVKDYSFESLHNKLG